MTDIERLMNVSTYFSDNGNNSSWVDHFVCSLLFFVWAVFVYIWLQQRRILRRKERYKLISLKPGFHYQSLRPEFTGRVDGPSTRVVNSGSGNRA